MPRGKSGVRGEVRAFIETRIDDQPNVVVADLTQDALTHFRTRADFIEALLRESLVPLVQDIARQVVAESRNLIWFGDQIVDQDTLTARAGKLSARWNNWLEHTGDRHILLLEMTKTDLLKAAQERRSRASTEIRLASLWETLAQRLEGDQKVRDVFSVQEIDSLAKTVVQAA